MSMKVCVIGGAGYVGLITGLGLAEIGHQVINVDVDRERIGRLQSGQSPIYEEGIEALLRSNLDTGRIAFSTELPEAVTSSEVVFVAVGTPSQEDGQADLSQVIEVAEQMVGHIESYKLIVIKSTVPVSTVELIRSVLGREKTESEDFDIVANPEFLREGKGLYDFFYPDRIVIGTSSKRARELMDAIYLPIIQGEVFWPGAPTARTVPVVETDIASAQIIKYASNAFLATRISFINEVAGLCEKVGADVKEVARGIGYDARIGHSYLEAGLGFGGPCLEKDLSALIKIAEGNGHDPHLLRAVLERNEKQVASVVAKLKHLVGNLLYQKTIAVFGLAFKAGTNDVRNSLALRVMAHLEGEGANLRACDPVAIPEVRVEMPNIPYFDDPYEATSGAHAILILTEWPCYRELNYQEIKVKMASPYIVDARNLLDPDSIASLGYTYIGVGRP